MIDSHSIDRSLDGRRREQGTGNMGRDFLGGFVIEPANWGVGWGELSAVLAGFAN